MSSGVGGVWPEVVWSNTGHLPSRMHSRTLFHALQAAPLREAARAHRRVAAEVDLLRRARRRRWRGDTPADEDGPVLGSGCVCACARAQQSGSTVSGGGGGGGREKGGARQAETGLCTLRGLRGLDPPRSRLTAPGTTRTQGEEVCRPPQASPPAGGLVVEDDDAAVLELCTCDRGAEVAALGDQRRREELPDAGHAAEPTGHRLAGVRATGLERARCRRGGWDAARRRKESACLSPNGQPLLSTAVHTRP